ncbi:hypothetical protein ANANG_G00236890 [Anguilla anguilla]|uniref:Uncharacterized protein n=1 Tax=Anguilla anguilla TaxID=7936 RepID=A0A9D3LUD7_ANGAN|nr:hypothetical protein ANANG_G00236890 [Anguilla anguilla]
MNEEKVQQQRKYNAIFKKLPFLEQYCPSSSQSEWCYSVVHLQKRIYIYTITYENVILRLCCLFLLYRQSV